MRLVAALLVLALIAALPVRADQQEVKVGDKIHRWLVNNGKIVNDSPLYDIANPIFNPIKSAADPMYDSPFVFILGRDPYPNIASTPGGRVYASEKTFDFIKYREEFAGALCHSVAHTVNHDYMKLVRKNANAQLGSLALWLIIMSGNMTSAYSSLGGWAKAVTTGNLAPGLPGATAAAGALSSVATLSAAEQAEGGADTLGADICAKAGINPYGLVWLLQNYKRAGLNGRMEMLTDNPAARVANLERHFAANPELFGKFDSDRAHATPLR
jgi:predicted Zn-dependent protease